MIDKSFFQAVFFAVFMTLTMFSVPVFAVDNGAAPVPPANLPLNLDDREIKWGIAPNTCDPVMYESLEAHNAIQAEAAMHLSQEIIEPPVPAAATTCLFQTTKSSLSSISNIIASGFSGFKNFNFVSFAQNIIAKTKSQIMDPSFAIHENYMNQSGETAGLAKYGITDLKQSNCGLMKSLKTIAQCRGIGASAGNAGRLAFRPITERLGTAKAAYNTVLQNTKGVFSGGKAIVTNPKSAIEAYCTGAGLGGVGGSSVITADSLTTATVLPRAEWEADITRPIAAGEKCNPPVKTGQKLFLQGGKGGDALQCPNAGCKLVGEGEGARCVPVDIVNERL